MMTPAGDPNDLEILLEADDLIPNSPTGEGDDLGGDSNESANPSNGASAGGSNESSASLRFPSPPIDVSVQVIPDDNTNKGTAVLATALASAPIAPAPSADMGTHGKSPSSDKQIGSTRVSTETFDYTKLAESFASMKQQVIVIEAFQALSTAANAADMKVIIDLGLSESGSWEKLLMLIATTLTFDASSKFHYSHVLKIIGASSPTPAPASRVKSVPSRRGAT